MDLAGIYHKANILIAQTYGITGVPEKGYVIVTVNNVRYIVYFYKIESAAPAFQIHFFFVQCSVSNFRNVVTLNLFLMNFWTSDAL
mgnify:CR=1 FL=1